MNKELKEALETLEKEKDIKQETLLQAIENSLLIACKTHFEKVYNVKSVENVRAVVDRDTYEFQVFVDKETVEEVEDPLTQISLADARAIKASYGIGDIVPVQIHSREFSRIATQNAKNVILQKIREEERRILFDQYYAKENEVVTGIVQRSLNKPGSRANSKSISINLGKVDAVLNENEQIKGETFEATERVKVYILEVKDSTKGPRITVSRTHPNLVKRLFESERKF